MSQIRRTPVRYRELLVGLALTDFRARHKGSLLGAGWSFAHPIATIGLYLFVYKVAMRGGETEGVPFALWLVVGFVPWFFFTDGLVAMSQSLVDYRYLVKKVVFEVTIIPAIKLLSSTFVAVVVWTVLLVVLSVAGYTPRLAWPQIPYFFGCILMLTAGLGLLTAAITPFVRDLTQMVVLAIQFGLWLTPILWPMSNAPKAVLPFVKLNPLVYVLQGLRDALLHGRPFWYHPVLTLYFWVFVILVNGLGVYVFTRLRPQFADVL